MSWKASQDVARHCDIYQALRELNTGVNTAPNNSTRPCRTIAPGGAATAAALAAGT